MFNISHRLFENYSNNSMYINFLTINDLTLGTVDAFILFKLKKKYLNNKIISKISKD